jgi:hypothetical protein
LKEKEAIWESFKAKLALEDNPDLLDERLVALHAFINARRNSRLKKLDQLLIQEADDEQAIEDIKTRGLEHVGEDFIVKIASAKRLSWAGIWKSIKKIDMDSNGYVTIEELDEIFREWFPLEMDGKSLHRFFRFKYGSVANKNLINYKQLKADLFSKILLASGSEFNDILSQKSSLVEPTGLGSIRKHSLPSLHLSITE